MPVSFAGDRNAMELQRASRARVSAALPFGRSDARLVPVGGRSAPESSPRRMRTPSACSTRDAPGSRTLSADR